MKRTEIMVATLILGGILLETPAAFADVKVQQPDFRKVEMLAQSFKKDVAYSHGSGSIPKEGFMCDLSDEQLQKMVSLRDRFQIATASKEAELRSVFHQTAAQLAAQTIDKKALSDLHSRAAKLQGEISDEHLKLMTDSAEILTPEQRQKMYQRMLKHTAGPGGFHMPPPFMGPAMSGFPGPPNVMFSGAMAGPPGGFPHMRSGGFERPWSGMPPGRPDGPPPPLDR